MDGGVEVIDKMDAGEDSLHLIADTLKNPCLDYIEHIIFSPPGATFSVGDTVYTDFATVRTAFWKESFRRSN
jgi:hypothetical protein